MTLLAASAVRAFDILVVALVFTIFV